MVEGSKAWSQYVIINPIEVIFRDARDNEGRSYTTIDILNKNRESVLFKIKTTDPAAYLVRPNQGLIPPDASLSIKIQCLLDIKMVTFRVDLMCKEHGESACWEVPSAARRGEGLARSS